MSFFQSVIYGAIQGVTELLPISSSGHLIIASEFFEIEPNVITLLFLHLASALALIVLYMKELQKLFKSKDLDYFRNIVLASIPVVLVGIIFGDWISETLYSTTFVAVNLVFWGVVMLVTEQGQIQSETRPSTQSSFLIGIMQMLSLLPGTSRSGITTIAGVWSGMSKTAALTFTFTMGIALLFGAFSFELINDWDTIDLASLDIVAFISTFIFSLLAGSLLKKFSKDKFLSVSGIYRIVMGIGLLVWML